MTVDLNTLVSRADPNTQREIVGITIYYLEAIEGKRPIEKQDVVKAIESAKTHVPKSNISTYISRMLNDGQLVPHGDSDFSLSISAEEEFQNMVGLGDIESQVRHYNFIEYTDTSDEFYQGLIEDINNAYQVGIDDAVLILSRKLLENLVLDLLRLRYGLDDEQRELFYDTENGRLRSFSRLINNLRNNIEDFTYFSDRLDDEILREVERLKGRGDASAHSIEVNVSEDTVEDHRERVNPVVEVLFYTKSVIDSAEENP